MIPHYAVTHAIRVSLAEYSRDAHRRLSMVSPAFDAAIEDYFGAFASGCTLFVADRVEFTKNPYPYLIQNRIDTFYISPTGLAHIDPDKLSKQRHSLTTIMFGGEVMAPSLLERWIRAFPDVHFFNMYGPTETAIQVSLKRITLKDISKTTSQQSSSAKKMSVGKPYPGVAFYVVDPHHSSHSGKELKLMDRNHMGELLIGGIQVGYGYLNRTIENTEHFLPDPYQWHRLSMPNGPLNSVPPRLYRTGDLVRWNSEGEIEFMGRIKGSFVKVRGCRVELFGVQAILERVPGVMMAVVSVERDSQKLESIVAYVKLKIDVGLKDVAREAKRRLGPHEVPNRYVQVDEFPMSPNGKVDMVALQGGDTESNEITIDAVSPARSHKSRPSPPCTPKSQKQKKHPSVNHLEVSLEEVNSTDVEVIANVLLKKAAIIFERPEIADLSIKVDLVRECGLNSITAVRFCSMVRNMYPTVEVDPHSLIHYARTPLELAGRILFTRISSPSPQMTELVQDQEPVQLSLSRPRPKSYILPDQSALFYGISFYSNYPAWFVNSLRKTLVHRIRLFTTVMLQLPKRDSSDPYFQRIDPIRLHQAVDRLYECHPVLSTQIRPEKKGIALLTKYSRKASLVVRQAPLIVPMETITLAGPEEVKKKMEAAGLKTTSSPFCLAYALDVRFFWIALEANTHAKL